MREAATGADQQADRPAAHALEYFAVDSGDESAVVRFVLRAGGFVGILIALSCSTRAAAWAIERAGGPVVVGSLSAWEVIRVLEGVAALAMALALFLLLRGRPKARSIVLVSIVALVVFAVLALIVFIYTWWWNRISTDPAGVVFVFITYGLAVAVEVAVPVLLWFVLRMPAALPNLSSRIVRTQNDALDGD